ncbi:MAG: SAM-dependent methyltransferase [Chitinispirillales bacterium]|jgi:hypothetical protein|nr:SAM-dependent methyltransferase [Chitinispirillales bacterium]
MIFLFCCKPYAREENMKTLEEIFTRLNLSKDALIRLSDEKWEKKVRFPSRISRLLKNNIKPAAFFYFDNKPLILFFENPKDKNALHQAIWNFNESPIAIILEKGVVEIFNGFKLLKEEKVLEKIGGFDKLNDFTYFELVTGKTWGKYRNELSDKNRVDYNLLNNIKFARELILAEFFADVDDKIKTKLTNALLGKTIFVRYLIDKKVKISFDDKSRTWTNDDFCELLNNHEKTNKFFNRLADPDKGFNGNLFPIENSEYEQIPITAYSIIKRLLKSEDMGSGQFSLFDLYDFSIIPIEFISNVYESFIGVENQAKDGAYYTPLFLVDYILSETIGKRLAETNDTNCKTLDPACGSGVFLVETLRKLIETYLLNNKDIKRDGDNFKSAIKKIAEDNIFGIDKDESAVQIARFSVYLTLLDYLDPPEIETFKFPKLSGNFFCDDFFNENAPFNRLKEKEFSFILGNPPWMRGKNEKKTPSYVKYINDRQKKEKIEKEEPIVEIGNKEIAQAFLLRSGDFSKENTKCALIVTSKVLYNLQGKDFRKYFLHNYFIERVFEMAPVRREIFDKSNDKAIAPACALFFKYAIGQNTDKNFIEHIALKPSRFFSMFKIFTLSRNDVKIVQQDRLKKYDWMWKVLVYGSYLDFNFIKRLYDDFDTVGNIINQEQIVFKQGIKRKDGNKQIKVSELIGKSFLDTQKKQLQPFMVVDSTQKWENEYVGYVYKENEKPYIELFQPYSLLITGGIFKDFTSNAAVNKKERIFTSSVRALKIKDDKQLDVLYSINSVLCSSVFSYYMLNLGASSGIEREESEDAEIENMWYIKIPNILLEASKIEEYEIQKNNIKNVIVENISVKERCDTIVLSQLKLSVEEKILLDYANNITIPIQMRHKGYERHFLPIKLDDNTLTDYADLFIDRFASNFGKIGKRFIVEIWHTQQIIGMFFKVISDSEYKQNISLIDKQKDSSGLFQKVTQLGTERITDKLFVQKDVRGFEKDYFYIFKPNEKRLWHKAIGYLDVDEFSDAILKEAGKNNHE